MRTLPHDCPHARVELRAGISSFASWEGEPPKNVRDWEAGWCPVCEHFVRREPGASDWTAFMEGRPTPA
jgi:hypothetical protein